MISHSLGAIISGTESSNVRPDCQCFVFMNMIQHDSSNLKKGEVAIIWEECIQNTRGQLLDNKLSLDGMKLRKV